MSSKERVFLDEEGNVVASDNPNVFMVRETVWEDGKLIRSAVYLREKEKAND